MIHIAATFGRYLTRRINNIQTVTSHRQAMSAARSLPPAVLQTKGVEWTTHQSKNYEGSGMILPYFKVYILRSLGTHGG